MRWLLVAAVLVAVAGLALEPYEPVRGVGIVRVGGVYDVLVDSGAFGGGEVYSAVNSADVCVDLVQRPTGSALYYGSVAVAESVAVYSLTCVELDLLTVSDVRVHRLAFVRDVVVLRGARVPTPTPSPVPTPTPVPVPSVPLHWAEPRVVAVLGPSEQTVELPEVQGGYGFREFSVSCVGLPDGSVTVELGRVHVGPQVELFEEILCLVTVADASGSSVVGVRISRPARGVVATRSMVVGELRGNVVEPSLQPGGQSGRGLLIDITGGGEYRGPGHLFRILYEALLAVGWPFSDRATLALLMGGLVFTLWAWMPPQMGPWRLAALVVFMALLPVTTPLQRGPVMLAVMWGSLVLVWQGRSVWQTLLPGMPWAKPPNELAQGRLALGRDRLAQQETLTRERLALQDRALTERGELARLRAEQAQAGQEGRAFLGQQRLDQLERRHELTMEQLRARGELQAQRESGALALQRARARSSAENAALWLEVARERNQGGTFRRPPPTESAPSRPYLGQSRMSPEEHARAYAEWVSQEPGGGRVSADDRESWAARIRGRLFNQGGERGSAREYRDSSGRRVNLDTGEVGGGDE